MKAMNKPTDEDLYFAVRRGDKSAFDVIYHRHSGPLLGFIFRFLHSREQSEEVLQEAFIKVFKGSDLDFARGSFRGWIYQVSRNLCLDYLRKANLERDMKKDPLSSSRQPLSQGSDINWQQNLREMQSKAEKLPHPLPRLFHLKSLGLSNQEIADSESIPIGTVKSRLHRMVHLLKEEIEI